MNQLTQIDDSNIYHASNLWFNSQERCIEEYGHISRWDVSRVTRMANLFYNRENFNEPLIWNPINVVTMEGMFSGCTNYNQAIEFDTRALISVSNMFENCVNFDKPVELYTHNVMHFNRMFYRCEKFNQPLTFDTRNATTMQDMFNCCTVFNFFTEDFCLMMRGLLFIYRYFSFCCLYWAYDYKCRKNKRLEKFFHDAIAFKLICLVDKQIT